MSWGQKLIQPLIPRRKDRTGYLHSHVSMYVGNGKIAESSPNGNGCEVRIISLDDPRAHLHKNRKYLVARPNEEQLGQEAAEVAKRVAEEIPFHGQDLETTHKYTKFEAFRSILHPRNFGLWARRRYVEQYFDDVRHQLPKKFMSLKSFFCSSFVGYCYQTAESRHVMPSIIGGVKPPKGLTVLDTALIRRWLARAVYFIRWGEMSEKIQMQFDALRMTPQDWRNFIVVNPHLFSDKLLIRNCLEIN